MYVCVPVHVHTRVCVRMSMWVCVIFAIPCLALFSHVSFKRYVMSLGVSSRAEWASEWAKKIARAKQAVGCKWVSNASDWTSKWPSSLRIDFISFLLILLFASIWQWIFGKYFQSKFSKNNLSYRRVELTIRYDEKESIWNQTPNIKILGNFPQQETAIYCGFRFPQNRFWAADPIGDDVL